jgi:uncharacterized protein YfkK (UPF0435 family)
MIDFYQRTWKDELTSQIREDVGMNLSEKSTENVEYMIEKIKDKLKVLNMGAIKPSHFDEEMYEDLRYLYEHIMKKDSFSPNEMQALAEELGNLRKV